MAAEFQQAQDIRPMPLVMLRPDALPVREAFLPTLPEVIALDSYVNAVVAVKTRMSIDAMYDVPGKSLDKPEKDIFADKLDRDATAIMERMLHEGPFVQEVIPNGCEGKKENRKAKEKGTGPTDLPVLEGRYGVGHLVHFDRRDALDDLDSDSVVFLTIDPVEGTSRASSNQEGSVAIMAGTLTGEIAPIPSEETPALYADRIVAAPRLKGKVALHQSPEKNVKAVMKEFGLTNPADVEVVLMERDRNKVLIDGLRQAGATLRLIKSGDLMPAIEALTQDRPMLSMGSGGKQEAVIAACGAKALGGVFQMRYVTGEGKPAEGFSNVLELDEVVSGSTSDVFVNFASITGVPELGMPVPQKENGIFVVPVATITSANQELVIKGIPV